MKTDKNYYTYIGNAPFKVNDEKTHVYFQKAWRKIESEPWGEYYFRCKNGAYRYIGIIGTI
jgi:hypothetical protein